MDSHEEIFGEDNSFFPVRIRLCNSWADVVELPGSVTPPILCPLALGFGIDGG